MRKYGSAINFLCLEAQTLAKKRFSFKVFFIAPFLIFICDDTYYDGSITIMWSLNIFINSFPLPCRRVKDQSCQDIRLRPTVHKFSASTFS